MKEDAARGEAGRRDGAIDLEQHLAGALVDHRHAGARVADAVGVHRLAERGFALSPHQRTRSGVVLAAIEEPHLALANAPRSSHAVERLVDARGTKAATERLDVVLATERAIEMTLLDDVGLAQGDGLGERVDERGHRRTFRFFVEHQLFARGRREHDDGGALGEDARVGQAVGFATHVGEGALEQHHLGLAWIGAVMTAHAA